MTREKKTKSGRVAKLAYSLLVKMKNRKKFVFMNKGEKEVGKLIKITEN